MRCIGRIRYVIQDPHHAASRPTVVLRTPPFPDVTTSALAIPTPSVQQRHANGVGLKPSVDGLSPEVGWHVLRRFVDAINRDKLRLEPVAKDASARISGRASNDPSAQRAVDVD